MDRPSKSPPFEVGTRIRYTGTRNSYIEQKGKRIPLLENGMEVTIIENRNGRQGTLAQARDEDGPMFYDDTNEPILDETRDGYSIYEVAGHRRIVDPSEWERV